MVFDTDKLFALTSVGAVTFRRVKCVHSYQCRLAVERNGDGFFENGRESFAEALNRVYLRAVVDGLIEL